MSATNQAALLPQKQAHPFTVTDIPVPTPKPNEVLIRNHAIAINPADSIVQSIGILWKDYPLTLGSDIAGEVVSVGSSVSHVKPGDRVIACMEQGAFAKYCVAYAGVVAKLADGLSYREGCVLPLGVVTAMMGLFHPDSLALDFPGMEEERDNGDAIVVWGASSSVGSCAVQMARAAGYEVIATASSHNEQYCKDLGASRFFDQRSESAVENIIAYLDTSDKTFAGVYCAIIAQEVIAKCAIISDCLGRDEQSRTVATVMAPGMPFDASIPDGIKLDYCAGLADILPESKLRADLDIPAIRPNRVTEEIWGAWLGKALEKGIMKCKPDPEVVGQGLESVQMACDRIAKGVSAKKLVVEI